MSRPRSDEFVCGFAIALAELIRLHDEPTLARDVIDGNGYALNDFERAGVDRYDLIELRKAFDL